MTENNWTVGIDIGATKIEVAGIDRNGNVLHHIRRKTNTGSSAEAIESGTADAVRELMRTIGTRPAAAGVGMAGQIDPLQGVVVFSPNLDWHNVPLRKGLAAKLGMPVAVTNDVRAATWGEWLYGAGRGYDDMVCVFVGTGIGGGVVSHGAMLTGCSNTAGEIGHITIDVNGPVCTCRNKGCLEALAGGWAIARDAQNAVADNPVAGTAILELADKNPKNITAKVVAMAAQKGDALALQLVERVSGALVAGAVSLVHAFNPCLLVFGGGVIEGLPGLVGSIDYGIRSRALGAAIINLKVVRSQLHSHAGVIGAAAFANHSFRDKGDTV